MGPVSMFLLSIAGIFLLGALGEIVFQRTNVPDVIWLIVAGILLGPITGMVSRELLGQIAPFFAAITLVIVLFEGGSALRLGELSQAAPRSLLLASLTFSSAVLVMALMSMAARALGLLPPEWTLVHGFMLGTILGGSSSIIVMPAMSRARMEPKVANLVGLESALTDALCVVGTTALMAVLLGSAAGPSESPLLTLGRQFGIALAVGLVSGVFWLLLLHWLAKSEHAYPITLSALLVLYVAVERAGGSAAFGILTFAVVLGNAKTLTKGIGLATPVELDSSVRGFHRQMTFIIKSFFFVFIGAMLGPPWPLIALGLLLGIVLFLVRVPAARLAVLGSGLSPGQTKIVVVSLPRGMAAGVLATLPAAAGVPGTQTLPVAVFAAVFTTILTFAVGFPLARRAVQAEQPPAPVVVTPPVPAPNAEPPAAEPPFGPGEGAGSG